MNRLQAYSLAFPGGATNIGDGMRAGYDSLFGVNSRPHAAKLLLVMTDGRHNVGTPPKNRALELKYGNVLMYSVTFSNEAEIPRMQEASAMTGGRNIHAATRAQLIQAFEELARALPSLLIK